MRLKFDDALGNRKKIEVESDVQGKQIIEHEMKFVAIEISVILETTRVGFLADQLKVSSLI